MNNIMEWLNSKDPRERLILISGPILLIVFLLYSAVWQPLSSGLDNREKLVASQRNTLAWMQQAAAEIKMIKSQGSKGAGAKSRQPLLTTIDRTAKAAKLRDVIRRVEPQGDNQVQLWVEKAPFDPLLQWLGSLQNRYSINVITISIERQGEGVVNARISLQSGNP